MITVEEAVEAVADRLAGMHPGWRRVIAEQDHSSESPSVLPFREACSWLAAALDDPVPSLNDAMVALEAAARGMPPVVRKAHIRMTYSPNVTMPPEVRAWWDSLPLLLAAVDAEEGS